MNLSVKKPQIPQFIPPFEFKYWKILRLLIFMIIDASILVVAIIGSYCLRLESLDFGKFNSDLIMVLALYIITNLAAFLLFGLYRQVWRYANYNSALLILKCIAIGTIAATVINYLLLGLEFPRSIPLIFILIAGPLIVIQKFSWRAYVQFYSRRDSKNKKKCLIYGAGSAGEMLVRNISSNPAFPFSPIGFIDDDKNKLNKMIHGYPILGSGKDLQKIYDSKNFDTIIIAIHANSGELIRRIFKSCEGSQFQVLIMPDVSASLADSPINLRKVDVSDLLRRSPASLDKRKIKNFFKSKRVLITGAGGSIGSEICIQISECEITEIILFDSSEFNLFKIEQELIERNSQCRIIPVLGSIANLNDVESVIKKHEPDAILHAAAYKHVPLIESNITTGITNNIAGTYNLAEMARKYNVGHFLLVSSDKAVRPTSVMGATKRCCELIIQSFHNQGLGKTQYSAVRFGNVLGSSGSVIPTFLTQIEKGGPLKVTHKDITRYFMLTSEAVGLVLQSMSMSHGGEIFVLNMGEPVRIYDMAKQLIRLSGLQPDVDINVEITGLRPGEKLFEELIISGTENRTLHEDVFVTTINNLDANITLKNILELLEVASLGDQSKSRNLLFSIIKNRPDTEKTNTPEQPTIH